MALSELGFLSIISELRPNMYYKKVGEGYGTFTTYPRGKIVLMEYFE